MLNSIPEAIEDIKKGKMLILVDDESRENEGDLIIAAESIRAEDINFMAKYARGLICLSMTPKQIDQLNLPLMVSEENNETPNQTAFTVSIEAAEGVTTGISASDRAHTVRVACAQDAKPTDLKKPGHIFPLRAKQGGVLERPGHTEGSIDLVKLANKGNSAVICEIMNDDGSMARLNDLREFAKTHSLKIVSIDSLIQYLKENL